jgi:hypothetical protein
MTVFDWLDVAALVLGATGAALAAFGQRRYRQLKIENASLDAENERLPIGDYAGAGITAGIGCDHCTRPAEVVLTSGNCSMAVCRECSPDPAEGAAEHPGR